MVNNFWLTAGALLIDRIVGDPSWILHPVIVIGKWIAFWEALMNRQHHSRTWKRISGCLLVVMTVGLFAGVTWFAVHLLKQYSPVVAGAVQLWIIATTIAWKGLMSAGRKVRDKLFQGDIKSARAAVGEIVGRDTDALSESEVTRAVVETLAENIVDGVVSPVFYGVLGGAPLAIAYRAVNTLDSMVGYKNEQFRYFGWASARFDDVLNYLPARITAGLLFVAAILTGSDALAGWRTYRRDAKKHPSPNSGIPEAFVAGALGVQLGGLNYYSGRPSLRPNLGFSYRELTNQRVIQTIRLVNVVGFIIFIVLVFGGYTAWLL